MNQTMGANEGRNRDVEVTNSADLDVRLEEYRLLRALLDGTTAETGERFFNALVRSVCTALGTHSAWVTELLPAPRRLRSLAMWFGDAFYPDYEYSIEGTPCAPVIDEKRLVHIPDRVIELFPDDRGLAEIGALSYMGVPLLDLDGSILGHLAVLDTRTLAAEPHVIAVFRIFAERAAAELRRLRAEKRLRRNEATLRRLVDGAMDAILELDTTLRISHANPSAEQTFHVSASSLLGSDFGVLLDPASRDKLTGMMRAWEIGDGDARAAWVAGGLNALRPDGTAFPAEATLSRSERGVHATYYTLVLRNVDDRVKAEQTIRSLTSEAEYLRGELAALQGFDEFVGRCPTMIEVLRLVSEVAETDTSVLITGETGTGKELVARALHARSRRRHRPLVTVNSAALPETLIESELFGHEPGAFTGAARRREGRFETANGGTLFLDEVGELPVAVQAKLLRVLQEGEFSALGSSKTRKVDVRVIAATNRDLLADVRSGRFREDLYYRLAVFPIHVPPLRERGDDVLMLADRLNERISRRLGRKTERLSEDARRRLRAYEWPGNVRELQNVLERAIIVSHDGAVDLGRVLPLGGAERREPPPAPSDAPNERVLRATELRDLEKRNILLALERTKWKITGEGGAAVALGVNPSTLTSRMKALGLHRPR